MGVLTGIRVLDFGRYVAGPYCATLLGYLGAEVIRIEKPDGGEDRYIAPVSASGEGGVFFQTACNKKSLTLDPAAPRGREIVDRFTIKGPCGLLAHPSRRIFFPTPWLSGRLD